MPGIFERRRSNSIHPYKQALARLIAKNLDGRPGTERSDEIGQAIIEQTYSFERWVNEAYVPLVNQYGPQLIAPIVFTLATKSWKIEHADGLDFVVHNLTPRHGFLVARCICQCFDYEGWLGIRKAFVQGNITSNGYAGAQYYSPESAGQVADETRRWAYWIAICGLMTFLELRENDPSNDFSSENAYVLRATRQELCAFPDHGSSFDDDDRKRCIGAIDRWLERYQAVRNGR